MEQADRGRQHRPHLKVPNVTGAQPALKIWGRNNSSNVQKAMWAVGETGVPYQRIDVGLQFGGNDTADYLALNPNGLIPTLQDGEFVLWESNSIIRYLAARYGSGTLEPADLQARARASQWMDWQISTFQPAFTTVFWGLIRTTPEQRDAALIGQAKAKSIAAAQIMDAALARQAFLAGGQFSMGDIPLGVFIYRFRRLVPERPALPHLERWYAEIAQRPAFREHVGNIPLT
jgi:glutathione S-transferase